MRRGVNTAACSAVFIALLFGCSTGHSRRHLKQLGEPEINGTIVSVPAGFAKCFVKVDVPEPDIDCKQPKNSDEAYFKNSTEVDLGLGELQSCIIEARFPPKKKPLVACLAIPPIIIEEVVLVGRELSLPYGAVKCTATKLQKGEEPTVKCDSPGPGSTEEYFAKGAKVEIPEGPFQRCDIKPQNSAVVLLCVELAPVVIPKPDINGREVTIPAGAAKCDAKNLDGKLLTVSCEPPMSGKDEPTFEGSIIVTMPGVAFESCEVIPSEDGGAKLNCREVQLIFDAEIKNSKISVPEGAALCMATSFKGEPIAVCVPAPFGTDIPTFPKGVSYELPVGDFGRCIYTPEQGAECDVPPMPAVQNAEPGDVSEPEIAGAEAPAVSEGAPDMDESAGGQGSKKKKKGKKSKKKGTDAVNMDAEQQGANDAENSKEKR